jgi:hypothetical protein
MLLLRRELGRLRTESPWRLLSAKGRPCQGWVAGGRCVGRRVPFIRAQAQATGAPNAARPWR